MLMLLLRALLLVFSLLSVDLTYAYNHQDSIHHQMGVEKTELKQAERALQALNQSLSRLQSNKFDQVVATADIKQAAMAYENAEFAQGSLQIAIADVSESIKLSLLNIQQIKRKFQHSAIQANGDRIRALQSELEGQQVQLGLQQQRMQLLKKLNQIRGYLTKQTKYWWDQLKLVYQRQQRQAHISRLMDGVAQLSNQQDILMRRLEALRSTGLRIPQDEPKVYDLQESITLNRLALYLTQLQVRAEDVLLPGESAGLLSINAYQIRDLQKQLKQLAGVVKSRIKYVGHHELMLDKLAAEYTYVIDKPVQMKKDLRTMTHRYHEYLTQIHEFQSRLLHVQRLSLERYKNQLYQREALPGFAASGWSLLLGKITVTPRLFWQYFKNTWRRIITDFGALATWQANSFYGMMVVFFVGGVLLYQYTNKAIVSMGELSYRFSQNLLRVIVRLLNKNLIFLLLILTVMIFEMLVDVDFSLWIDLLLVFTLSRIVIQIARLLLVNKISEEVNKDVNWFYRLRWFFVVAAVLTVFIILCHRLPVDGEVKGLFNRLFMVVLFAFSILLFRAWSILPRVLQAIFAVKRNYILNAIRLFCRILPVTLLFNAVVGLIGYVHLAWLICQIQGVALLVMLGYMVVRGLLNDFIELCYELMIRYVKNGWLWTQVLLKPADKILRLSLFLLAIWILVVAYRLDENQHFLTFVKDFYNAQIITLGRNVINVAFMIKMTVFLAVLYWVGKWSRELSFRWLYIRARDIGTRNSLSVFTQYAVVIFGVLIGLRLLGVDLKGLAVVAAAFAAGIGFGLRDLLNNFFSGILLLVERPFRTGDSVTLGQYEGEIISTGMRSMKIRTWDRMDVIVPNSDMFTKPFTNWTHQDSIVRTVIKIKIDRVDDPSLVQSLIYQVLKGFDSVVEDPKPEVFMKAISEALLELEVRYFINLQVVGSRPRVRSEVLFAIWTAFEDNGIRPPFPHYDVRMSKE